MEGEGEEEYYDADSEAPTQENTTDQNDNVTEAEKHEQKIPHPDVKVIEKLFQEQGWNKEEEELDDEQTKVIKTISDKKFKMQPEELTGITTCDS